MVGELKLITRKEGIFIIIKIPFKVAKCYNREKIKLKIFFTNIELYYYYNSKIFNIKQAKVLVVKIYVKKKAIKQL